MILWTYLPMLYFLYNILYIQLNKHVLVYVPQTNPSVLAQYAMGVVHVHGVIVYKILFVLYGDSNTLLTHAMSFSVCYFVFDLLFILIKDRSQKMYIPHHIVSILLGIAVDNNLFDINIVCDYVFFIELSNYFLSIWDLSKNNKNSMRHIYELTTPFFALTYIPLRTVFLSYTTYKMMLSTKDLHIFIWPLLLFILGISYWFSYKVWNIFKRKILQYEEDNDTKLYINNIIYKSLKNKSILWPIGSYIIKLYINLYYLIFIIPYTHQHTYAMMYFMYVDVLHIIISIWYNILEWVNWIECVDFMSINFKIFANGFIIYTINYNINSNTTWDTFIYLHLIYLMSLGIYLCIHKKIPGDGLLNRYIGSVIYVISFSFTVIPIFTFVKSNISLYYSFIMYILSLLIWTFKLPEKWYRHSIVFNSVGWMHVFVSLAEIFLMSYIQSVEFRHLRLKIYTNT